MKHRKHIAIDLGAGSGRIMLGNKEENSIRLKETARFQNKMKMTENLLCWDYENLINNIIAGLKITCAELDKAPESISCDSWAQDFGLLDSKGKVFSRIISYREKRAAGMAQKLSAVISKDELKVRIGKKQIFDFSSLAQLKFMTEYESEILNNATHLLHIADLIHYELCGAAISNWALTSVSQMMNLNSQTWDLDLLDKLQIPFHYLGELKANEIIGYVNDSRFPDILQGVPVISGIGHDTAAAFFAAEPENDTLFLSLGTWAMLGQRIESLKNFPDKAGIMGIFPGYWAAFYSFPGMWILQQCIQAWEKKGIFPGYEAFDAAVDTSDCRGVFDLSSKELFNPADMPAQIRILCEKNNTEIPITPADYGKVINRSLAQGFFQAVETDGPRKRRELLISGGGLNNTPLIKELKAYFSIKKGIPEASAYGNVKAQINVLC